MKKVLIIAAIGLGACSKPAPAPEQAEAPAAAPAASASPSLASTSQWLSIAHTDAQGGGVWIDPSLTKTDAASGLTDIVLKVDHGELPALDAQGAGNNLYRIEKVTFRFNCANKTYAVVKREALNQKGDVLDTTEGNTEPAGYKAVAPKGVSSVAITQACPAK